MVSRAWVWSAIHGPALGVAGPDGLSGSGLTHGKEQEEIRKGSEETHGPSQSPSQCCLHFSSRSSWCRICCTVNRYGLGTHCLTLPESLLCREASVDHHFSSIQFSCSVMSNSLQPYGLQHTRPPCPSPTPRVYSNSCPWSQWCHPAISSSVVPFFSHLESFPASGSFLFF